jgi:hypothetical protein
LKVDVFSGLINSITWSSTETMTVGINILHTRIRNNCSALHNDLFHANLIHSPSCSCGYSTENAEHFFLYCKRFNAQSGNNDCWDIDNLFIV